MTLRLSFIDSIGKGYGLSPQVATCYCPTLAATFVCYIFFWLTAFSGHIASDETELDISTYFMNYLTAPIMLIFSIQSCWRYTKILLIFQGSASHLFVGAPMVK